MQFLLYASVWQHGGSVISVDEQFNCTVLWQAAEEHQDSGWDVHPFPPLTVPSLSHRAEHQFIIDNKSLMFSEVQRII